MSAVRRLRVFLASPGDVATERQIAREILGRLPYDALVNWRLVFEVVAWDQPGAGPPMLATMTPQAAIAAGLPKPSECDVVIVIVWRRMGTPLPDDYRKPNGSAYVSGTEWEYLDALGAAERSGKPILLVYRRTGAGTADTSRSDVDAVSQAHRVQEFFAAFRNPDGSIRRGCNDYVDPEDFRRQFEQHLRAIVARALASPEGLDVGALPTEPGAHAVSEPPPSSTTVAGFVGPTERGPTRPQLLLHWDEYVQTFGAELPAGRSFLAHGVRGFFENGGGRAYVVRVLGRGASRACVRILSADGKCAAQFQAGSPGTWGNRLCVRVRGGTRFGVRIGIHERVDGEGAGDASEKLVADFDNLGLEPGGPNFAVDTINQGSRHDAWVLCTEMPTRFTVPPGDGLNMLAGGSDGAPPEASDFLGTVSSDQGLSGLAALATLDDVALLCVPDQVHPRVPAADRVAIAHEMVAQCERLQDRFALLGVEQEQGDVSSIRPVVDSSFAALFHPWICVQDPATRSTTWIPPVAHVAGIFARNDIAHGVHHAPVGEEVRGLAVGGAASSVAHALDANEIDTLLRMGVNAIGRNDDAQAVRLLSAVTTSVDARQQSIAQRRMLSFVQTSIIRGTRWAVAEANDKRLWANLREAVSNFLTSVWRDGALRGSTAEEAFFIRCDETTVNPHDIENGRAIIHVGLALQEPPVVVVLPIVIEAGRQAPDNR